MKKITVLILPLICCFLFSGCGKIYFTNGIGKNDVFQVEGNVCTYKEALIYLAEEKSAYEDSFGENMWDEKIGEMTVEEYVKDIVKNKLAKIECMNLLASEEAISLTSDELSAIEITASEYYSLLTDEEIQEMDLTLLDVIGAYSKYALSEKVFNKLTQDVVSEVSDADAKVIKIQTIFMKTDESEMKKILKKIKNGEDFFTLAEDNTQDEEIEYIIKKGDCLPEFEDAAYELKTGEVSGLIETEKGYYIIKCISDYMADESIVNKANLLEEEKENAFQLIYNPFVDKLKYKFNNSLWKKVDLTEITTLSKAEYYGVFEEYYK